MKKTIIYIHLILIFGLISSCIQNNLSYSNDELMDCMSSIGNGFIIEVKYPIELNMSEVPRRLRSKLNSSSMKDPVVDDYFLVKNKVIYKIRVYRTKENKVIHINLYFPSKEKTNAKILEQHIQDKLPKLSFDTFESNNIKLPIWNNPKP